MKRIVGIFHSEDQAVRAIEGLRTSGYTDDEISIIAKDEDKYNALTNRVGTDIGNDIKDSSGAAAGAVTGGTIGGLGGLLLGLGALAIPGVGPIIAAGPIAAAVTGALAGGALGGLAGALIDYGVPEVDAKEYEERINAGDILILVDDKDDDTRRDTVYNNFYENDSINRDTYRHRDRDPIGDNRDYGTDTDMGVKGHSGNTNNMVDSYQKTVQDDPLYKDKVNPAYDDSVTRDRGIKEDNFDTDSINRDMDRSQSDLDNPLNPDVSRKPFNTDDDPINRDRDRSNLTDEPMTTNVNDPINRDMDRNLPDADDDPLGRNAQSPAYSGGIATPDKGWNEDINNPEENLENTDHVVEGHDQYIDENDPLKPKKPHELDPNLRDVDKGLR
ncbi:general stress protein [Proteiniclasticum sp.]|uniref:general stress protein n=1 Tax=Proteiniclasticum sp. TaxID=2053595 RepID=UPI00289637D7|nr:general stress protein [Proteiniclasticum sp.]